MLPGRVRYEREAGERLEGIARHLGREIDDHVERHAKLVESYAAFFSHTGGDPEDLRRGLAHQSAVFDSFKGMLVADLQGRIVASSLPSGAASIAGGAAFTEPLRTGRTFVSEVFRDWRFTNRCTPRARVHERVGPPRRRCASFLRVASHERLTHECRHAAHRGGAGSTRPGGYSSRAVGYLPPAEAEPPGGTDLAPPPAGLPPPREKSASPRKRTVGA